MDSKQKRQGLPLEAPTEEATALSLPFDWQAALDSIDVSIGVFNSRDQLVAWNREYAAFAGPFADQFQTGMSHLDSLILFARAGRYGPGEPQKLAEARLQEIHDGRIDKEQEVERPDGTFDHIRWARMDDGGLVAIRTAIDDRKRIETDLAVKSTVLQIVLQTLDQPSVVWDGNRKLLAWNEEYLAVMGLKPEDVYRGLGMKQLVQMCAVNGLFGPGDPEEQTRQRLEKVVGTSGNDVPLRDAITRPNGKTYDLTRSMLPDGGFVSIYHDVTEREHMAEQLRLAIAEAVKANALKSDFLAGMSHELRTPLNAIIGFSELMIYTQPDEDPLDRYRGYAGNIRDSAVTLLNIINDLLDLAKIESGRMQLDIKNTDVHAAADRVLELVSRSEGAAHLSFENAIPTEFPRVAMDALALRQVLLKLLSNAVKATPDGGRISVGAELAGESEIEISVTDTGLGIPEDVLDTIFDPYRATIDTYARKAKGTGLGLGIVKRLVDLMQGEILIESEPGRGTCVRLRLPKTPAMD